MNIEHCDCLSWFSRRRESHKQDGETLSAQQPSCKANTASGDPAMAFGPSSMRRTFVRRSKSAALSCRTCGGRLCAPPNARGIRPRASRSTADTQPFNQLFVTSFVGTPQIIENLPALRNELEQPAPRVIVFHMRFEVLGQIVDPLRQERNLNLRRTCVAGLYGVRLDNLRLACGRNRHRHQPFCLSARPVTPDKLNTRLGTISPRSISAIATSCPPEATWTVPRMTAASRPRNKTAWPLLSLAASAGLTASAGMSSSAVSTGSSRSARFPSPEAALWHKASSRSSEIMSLSMNGLTRLRLRAETWPKLPSIRPISRASART